MATTYTDTVQLLGGVYATDADITNSLHVGALATVEIGEYRGTGKELGDLLNMVRRIAVKDYPEEFL